MTTKRLHKCSNCKNFELTDEHYPCYNDEVCEMNCKNKGKYYEFFRYDIITLYKCCKNYSEKVNDEQ